MRPSLGRKGKIMLKEFLEARRERIQNLIKKGFEVRIDFENNPVLGPRVVISITLQNPFFCKVGSYWIKDEDDRGFTEALEIAEKLNIDKTIVDDFINSLSK